MPNELSRRAFLNLLAATGLGVLAGCTSDLDSASTASLPVVTTGGGDGDLWSVWDQVRADIETRQRHKHRLIEAGVAHHLMPFECGRRAFAAVEKIATCEARDRTQSLDSAEWAASPA